MGLVGAWRRVLPQAAVGCGDALQAAHLGNKVGGRVRGRGRGRSRGRVRFGLNPNPDPTPSRMAHLGLQAGPGGVKVLEPDDLVDHLPPLGRVRDKRAGVRVRVGATVGVRLGSGMGFE